LLLRPSLLLTAMLGSLWAIVEPRTADLAAQVYRSDLFARDGFTLWDNAWFAGHQILGYSVVFPPLASGIGLRAVGLLSVVVSVLCVEDLVTRLRPGTGPLVAVWFAAAAVGDLFIGRLTFALGTAVALLALVALTRRWLLAGSLLCAACALASPVAGMFLGLILVSGWGAAPPRVILIAGGALAMTLAVGAVLFSDGGQQPDGIVTALVTTATAIVVWTLLDPGERFLRRAVGLYAAASIAAYLLPTPMGSNVARLGILALGPIALCARRRGAAPAFAACAVALLAWQIQGPVTETVKAADSNATNAAYFTPLVGELRAIGVVNERVEVVPTSTRWESVYVAQHTALARGWETQLDRSYNALFYRSAITPRAYRRWLARLRVGYVAISDSTPQSSGAAEARLLARPPAYLRLVWHSRHWRLFAVADPQPIATGAALIDLAHSGLALRFRAAGTATVAVHYTSFWHASAGACVRPGRGDTTAVTATRAGVVRVRATWIPTALIDHDPCTA
jgi:hypothetical protein